MVASAHLLFLIRNTTHIRLAIQKKSDVPQTKKRGGKQKDAEEVAQSYVNKFLLFGKHKLAAYANSETGCPFYLDKEETEGEFFGKGNVIKKLSKHNSEMCKRPGMAISLSGGSLDAGCKAMLKHMPSPSAKDQNAEQEKYKKSGVGEFMCMLASEKGKKLVEAFATINVGQHVRRSTREIDEAVNILVDTITKERKSLRKILGKTASTCAKIYLMSMAFIEMVHLVLLTGFVS